MDRCAILLDNILDGATVDATSALNGMGPGLLLSSPHVWDDQWCAAGNSERLSFDLRADVALDVFALFGLNLTAAATQRLRISSAGAGPAAGDALDTGTLASPSRWFDPDYHAFVWRGDAAVTGRYIDIDLEDTSIARLQAGKAAAGAATEFTYSFSRGSAFDWRDPSPKKKTIGGQTLSWSRRKFRAGTLTFNYVTDAQRWSLIESLGRDIGVGKGVLIVLKTSADNLPQKSAWVTMNDQTPAAWVSAAIHSKQLAIEERG